MAPASPIERALDCAHDYLVSLLDRAPVSAKRERPEQDLYSHGEITKADEWLAQREREWAAAGRLNAYGFLRVNGDVPRWTLATVRACFPRANALACVIALNGMIEEKKLKEIVSLIRQIVREEVQRVYSESLAEARESRSALWAGRAADGTGRRRRQRPRESIARACSDRTSR